jgi:hypothetical protein
MSSPVPKLNINIIPDRYRGWRFTFRHLLLSLAAIAIVVVMIPVYGAVTGVIDEVSDLKSEREALYQQAEARNSRMEERTAMSKLVKQYQIITDKRGLFTDDLLAITRSAEEVVGIEIESISHPGKDETISVDVNVTGYSGYSDYVSILDDFRDTLVRIGGFDSVEYPEPETPPIASVTVEITPVQEGEEEGEE